MSDRELTIGEEIIATLEAEIARAATLRGVRAEPCCLMCEIAPCDAPSGDGRFCGGCLGRLNGK